jgi:hypothetical protein
MAYLLTDDVDVPFEPILEAGIAAAEQRLLRGPYDVAVDVDFDDEGDRTVGYQSRPQLDLDRIAEKILEGRGLEPFEFHELVRVVANDRERFLDATERVDVPHETGSSVDGALSRGRSLVLMARALSGDGLDVDEVDMEVIHEDVRSAFNLDWRT